VISSSNNININIIKFPLINDKSTRLIKNNKYSFIVDYNSDKITIKNTIEYLFNVKVVKVNSFRLPHKKKRIGKSIRWKSKLQYKKAIVSLVKGDIIDLFTEN